MKGQAVINPVFGKKSEHDPTFAVMAATLPDVSDLALSLCGSKETYRDFFSSRLYRGEVNGKGFYLTGPFIGAPHAAILLENLVVRGVTHIVFTGWCGSLSKSLAIGDVFAADGAFSDEGTSWHYGISNSDALLKTPSDLNNRLLRAMERLGLSLRSETVWTTDALYRETTEKIEEFRGKGAMAVDMELSALLSVSAFRGVFLAGLFLTSDSVENPVWQPGFKNPRFKTGRKHLVSIIKNLLENWENDHGP